MIQAGFAEFNSYPKGGLVLFGYVSFFDRQLYLLIGWVSTTNVVDCLLTRIECVFSKEVSLLESMSP